MLTRGCNERAVNCPLIFGLGVKTLNSRQQWREEDPFSPQFKDFSYEVFLRIRKILPPFLQSLLLPTRLPNKRSPVPFGVKHRRLGEMLLRISKLGWGHLGAPLRFASARKGNARFRGTQPRCPALVQGSAFRASPSRGGGPRGLPRPPPTALRVQRLLSPGGSCAPGSQPDGFRNRVAAVSALRQPHLCRPALGSPTAPRSEPGNPTLAGTEREPPTSCSRAPRCGSRAGETVGLVPRRCAPPAVPGGAAPDTGGGGGGCPGLWTSWVCGKSGALPE